MEAALAVHRLHFAGAISNNNCYEMYNNLLDAVFTVAEARHPKLGPETERELRQRARRIAIEAKAIYINQMLEIKARRDAARAQVQA